MNARERVARAIAPEIFCYVGDLPWAQREREKALTTADDVLAVVADVDEIAAVLAKHSDLDGSMNECNARDWVMYDEDYPIRLESFARHQAEVVAAHLRGAP